jgi:hypothetical protein
MKIYKSCYRNHWISPYTVLEYIFFWTAWSKCGRNRGVIEDQDYVDHPAWVERATDYIEPFSRALQWFLDLIHPQINYVKLDPWDTWSMDHTLADIVLPMLRQLKATKHGAPQTDDEDVPEYLRSYMAQPKEHEWDTDSLHFMRWDWILDEMIWAFEQKVKDDAEGQFFDHSAYEKVNGKTNHDEWFNDMTVGASKIKYDQEGHKKWLDRKHNGFRLFGKYYEALWD